MVTSKSLLFLIPLVTVVLSRIARILPYPDHATRCRDAFDLDFALPLPQGRHAAGAHPVQTVHFEQLTLATSRTSSKGNKPCNQFVADAP